MFRLRAFNHEKAPEEAIPVIVKTDGSFAALEKTLPEANVQCFVANLIRAFIDLANICGNIKAVVAPFRDERFGANFRCISAVAFSSGKLIKPMNGILETYIIDFDCRFLKNGAEVFQ